MEARQPLSESFSVYLQDDRVVCSHGSQVVLRPSAQTMSLLSKSLPLQASQQTAQQEYVWIHEPDEEFLLPYQLASNPKWQNVTKNSRNSRVLKEQKIQNSGAAALVAPDLFIARATRETVGTYVCLQVISKTPLEGSRFDLRNMVPVARFALALTNITEKYIIAQNSKLELSVPASSPVDDTTFSNSEDFSATIRWYRIKNPTKSDLSAGLAKLNADLNQLSLHLSVSSATSVVQDLVNGWNHEQPWIRIRDAKTPFLSLILLRFNPQPMSAVGSSRWVWSYKDKVSGVAKQLHKDGPPSTFEPYEDWNEVWNRLNDGTLIAATTGSSASGRGPEEYSMNRLSNFLDIIATAASMCANSSMQRLAWIAQQTVQLAFCVAERRGRLVVYLKCTCYISVFKKRIHQRRNSHQCCTLYHWIRDAIFAADFLKVRTW